MIDLKKFKKVSSDKHTTVMRHDDGHELKVVHSVLSPKLRKDVEKLPMADGGEVDKKEEGDKTTVTLHATKKPNWQPDVGLGSSSGSQGDRPVLPSEVPISNPTPDYKKYAEGGDIRRMEDNQVIPEQPEYGMSVEPAPTGNAQGADSGMFGAPAQRKEIVTPQPMAQDITGSVPGHAPQENPLLKQLNDIAKPNPELSRQTQQALQSNIDQNAQISQNFMNSKAKIDSEHQALVHDIMNNHINMGDYWKHNDKGAAALGALLGGMGSGLTGHANPVPGMIANSQENFLKAEMANMDNPKSLLSAVQAQYGNNRDAADVMRIISNEALNAHLQKVMAPLNSATAQANAAHVQMQLMQNTETLKQQLAMRQAMSAGGSNMDPSMAVRFLVPSDRQKEVFDEIGKAQNAKSAEANLMGMFDAMNKENTIMGRAGRLGATPPSVSSYEANILPLIRDKEGRVNEFELQTVRALEPKPGDKPNTVEEKKIGLQKFLQGKQAASVAKGFGIDLDKFSSTSQAPSVETATMNGKLYRKVPGGWAPVQ